MTTPVVATTSNGTWSGTSATVTQPTVVNSGDLLLIFIGGDGTGGVTGWPAGYNELYNTGSNGCFAAAAWKDADGTEDSVNVTVNTSNEVGGWQCYRITGAGDPAVYPPFISSVSSGVASSPTPNSVDAPGTKDFLYLIHGGFDRASYMTGAPTGYSNIITSTQTSASSGNSSVCEKATTASDSDTPGAATTNTSDGYNIYTIAIEDSSGALHEGDLTSAAVGAATFSPVAAWVGDATLAAVASFVPPSSVERPGTVSIAAVSTLLADSQNLKEGTLTLAASGAATLTGVTTLVGNLTSAAIGGITLTAQNLKQAVLTAAHVSAMPNNLGQNLKHATLTATGTGAFTASVHLDYAGNLAVVAPASAVLDARADYIVQLNVYSPATYSRIYGGFTFPAALEINTNTAVALHGTRIRKPINLRITKAGLMSAPPRS